MHRFTNYKLEDKVMKTNSFETALSDDHHMIHTFRKAKFEKFEPKKLIYHNFKQFDIDEFKLDIVIVCL